MKGTRPLDNTEIRLVSACFNGMFAQRLYDRIGDIFAVQEMLAHKSVATTQKYLVVNDASLRTALEEMAISSELHTIITMYSLSRKPKKSQAYARVIYDIAVKEGLVDRISIRSRD